MLVSGHRILQGLMQGGSLALDMYMHMKIGMDMLADVDLDLDHDIDPTTNWVRTT